MFRSQESAKDVVKIGDRVYLRVRFTHLYPNAHGVIVGITLDPIRSMFNEYTVEFPDESTDKIFQFQIYRTERTY
jgi:hypothetical protein